LHITGKLVQFTKGSTGEVPGENPVIEEEEDDDDDDNDDDKFQIIEVQYNLFIDM
jgi:hypothetical protein